MYKPASTWTLSNFSHPFMDTYRCNTPSWKEFFFIMCLLSSHCYKLLIGDYTERRAGKGGSIKWTAHNHSVSSKTLNATFFCGQVTKVMDVMSSEVRRAGSLCSAQSAPRQQHTDYIIVSQKLKGAGLLNPSMRMRFFYFHHLII